MYLNLIRRLKTDLAIHSPVDLKNLIGKFNDIEINYGQELIDKDGLVEKIENKYIIKIKSKEEELSDSDRFVIARELGHIFLNHIDNYNVLYKNGNNEIESAANAFAAELLMPENEFITVVNTSTKNGICDLITVSKQFGVSTSLILTRGRFLGIFPW